MAALHAHATPVYQLPDSMMAADPQAGSRTVWVGDLDAWVDEGFLWQIFANEQPSIANVKLIRDKVTFAPAGYGFVEFKSHQDADRVIRTYSGQPLPGHPTKKYRLNWATYGVNEPSRPSDLVPKFSIFVGDLAPEVTDFLLESTFRANYSSTCGAKVVTDPATGRSKGFGFVRFLDEDEGKRAMVEMNGVYLLTRAMRISHATPKKNENGISVMQPSLPPPVAAPPAHSPMPPMGVGMGMGMGMGMAMNMNMNAAPSSLPSLTASMAQQGPHMYGSVPAGLSAGGGASAFDPYGGSPDLDPSNTTVFIGNLHASVTEDMLRAAFAGFGDIKSVKIPIGKGCGFVEYREKHSAERAIASMHGAQIGPSEIRCSWGKNAGKSRAGPALPPNGFAAPPPPPPPPQSSAPYGYAAYGANAAGPAASYGGSSGTPSANSSPASHYGPAAAMSPYTGYGGHSMSSGASPVPSSAPASATAANGGYGGMTPTAHSAAVLSHGHDNFPSLMAGSVPPMHHVPTASPIIDDAEIIDVTRPIDMAKRNSTYRRHHLDYYLLGLSEHLKP